MAADSIGLHRRSGMGLTNQSATPGRTSLLDAVNILLANIGEQPVSTLEDQQVLEARNAEDTVLEFHKEGQTRGWSWNTERDYPFTRNDAGEISVPANAISWQPDPYQFQHRYQLRGQRVYDKWRHTYLIEEKELLADVVWLLPWDECPEAYNRWSLIRSARVFSARTVGDMASVQYTQVDEQQALIELLRVENAQEAPNMITGRRRFPTFQPAEGLTDRLMGGVFL
jgi:hypothetical protein